MKKLSVILAVLLALTMLPAVGASAAMGQNVIQNGDFETIDETGFATGWTRNADTYVSIKSVSGVDGQATNVAAFIKPPASQNFKFKTNGSMYPIDSTKDYVFSFDHYRTAGASNYNITIVYRDENGDKVKDAQGTELGWKQLSLKAASTDKWEHKDFVISNIAEGTRIFEITFQNSQNVSSSAKAAEVYLDNISIAPIESEATYTEDEAAGTVAVSYNAYLPTSYAGDATRVVAMAALYKTVGDQKVLSSVIVSQPTALTKGDFTPVTLGTLNVPKDGATYSCRVISLDFGNNLVPLDELPIQEVF